MIDKQERFWKDTDFPTTNNATLSQVLDFGRNLVPGTDQTPPGTAQYTTLWPEGIGLVDVFMVVSVGSEAFAGLNSVQIRVDVSADGNTWTNVMDTGAIARANLTSGKILLQERFPHDDRFRNIRQVRVRATGSGSASAGNLSANLTAGGVGVPGQLERQVEYFRGRESALPKWRTVANPTGIPNN